MSDPETFLTVAEIAELLKLNPQTVRNWIDRGELSAVGVGSRRVRVKQSDLDRFIEAGATVVPVGDPEPGSANQLRLRRMSSEISWAWHSPRPVARLTM